LALFLAGVINTLQALAGFSDSPVVMIATLFIVGEGLSQTGVTAWMGTKMINLAGTAILSAFISNTEIVAALIPAVVVAVWRIKSVPNKFLILLAFASQRAVVCTTAPLLVKWIDSFYLSLSAF
jgi:di/tricarboxylate transporter